MPIHPSPYLVLLPLLALVVWRRLSRSFGRQPIRRKRMLVRIVIFAVVGALLALSGWHRPILAEGLLGGVLTGGAIGLLGLRLTRFETDPARGDCYVPHPWIGALLTVLLLVRLGWRLSVWWPLLQSSSSAAPGMPPEGYAASPLTMLLVGLLVGYYVTYYSGLLIHHRRFQRLQQGASTV